MNKDLNSGTYSGTEVVHLTRRSCIPKIGAHCTECNNNQSCRHKRKKIAVTLSALIQYIHLKFIFNFKIILLKFSVLLATQPIFGILCQIVSDEWSNFLETNNNSLDIITCLINRLILAENVISNWWKIYSYEHYINTY